MEPANEADHPARVAAHLRAVEEALGRLQGTFPRPARAPELQAALEVVRRWLAGQAIPNEALAMAADALPLPTTPPPTDPAERAWRWMSAAVTSLLWLAQRERGWRSAEEHLLDAACYAQEATEGALDRARCTERWEAALEAVRSEGAPVPSAQAGPPPMAPPTTAAALGPVLGARVRELDGALDPRRRTDRAGLEARLEALGFEAPASLWTFEEAWGGAILDETRGRDERHITLGAFSCAHVGVPPERGRLPVAIEPGDTFHYLDPDGTTWVLSAIDMAEPAPFAPSLEAMVARILLWSRYWESHWAGDAVRLERSTGRAIADALGLPVVEVASGPRFRAWADSSHQVIESTFEGETATLVAGPEARRYADAPR